MWCGGVVVVAVLTIVQRLQLRIALCTRVRPYVVAITPRRLLLQSHYKGLTNLTLVRPTLSPVTLDSTRLTGSSFFLDMAAQISSTASSNVACLASTCQHVHMHAGPESITH